MTHQPGSIQATTAGPTVVADLIRRHRDLEVPAPGLWRMAPGSYVAIAPSRRDPLIARRVLDGAIDIDESPDQSAMHFTVAGPDEMTFQGRPTGVVANHHGMSEWAIEGDLTLDERSTPVMLVVSYHGVYRSSGECGRGSPDGEPWWFRRNLGGGDGRATTSEQRSSSTSSSIRLGQRGRPLR